MSLQQRLDDYEVTVVPGSPRLRLAWSVADEPPGACTPTTPDAEESGWIDLLESYRITRIPVRAAG